MPKNRLFLLPLVLSLSACGGMPKLDASSFDISDKLPVYRQDIRQGNFVSQEMVSQLKPGLTREQVRYVMGTPLVTDPFHGNRWDYVYRYDNGTGDTQQRTLSVYFEDNKLARVGGNVVAADPNAVASGATVVEPAKNDAAKIPATTPATAVPPAAAQ